MASLVADYGSDDDTNSSSGTEKSRFEVSVSFNNFSNMSSYKILKAALILMHTHALCVRHDFQRGPH